ncbi:SusC/RagA family TonB-linked outer membrane protein [Sphingobacterium sp. DR205]|uniref:SusC/RagA family TonB-linked outer membrane protein n=1 Tax=Sphingobacterium sp. DR205 TaxID=2713573 RepID=UPI0013E4BB36|nr:SusC/RagA family TonB-linked outer membrane protein [Sphingobacterium sp. DR205]QIH34479.1 SusC/RagA family TonB-linked outer membrane protein [Sphingobacterium sp. DR205]
MKNLCTATIFFLLGINSLSGQQQQTLSKMRVKYEAGALSAPEAIERFLSENKIKQYAYSKESLKGYKVSGTKCVNESIIDCLGKMLRDIPFEVLIYNNTVIIREKKTTTSAKSDNVDIIPVLDTLRSTKGTESIANREATIEEVTLSAGYYSVKAKERTGSISKVTAKEIENQPVLNVLSALQGRMTGVNISQNSGVAGGGYNIQIRGQNSLRTSSAIGLDGNIPLYIVDGVPLSNALNDFSSTSVLAIPGGRMNPLNSINPNDIESVEVLKDADATAIYGSKGANGVILITTKKGRSGKIRTEFTTSYGISEAFSNIKLMNKEQYLYMRRSAFANEGITTFPINAYDLNGTWENNEVDWVKTLIGHKATSSDTQISLTGGSDTTSFLVSLGHNEQTTVYAQGFKYISNTINTNLSHRSKDKKLQINISNMFSSQKNNVVRAEIASRAYTLAPVAPDLYKSDGSLNWAGTSFTNPLAAFNASYTNDSKLFQSNANAEYKIYRDLKFRLNAGLNYTTVDELSLMPNTMYNPAIAVAATSAYSQAAKRNQQIFSLITEPQLSWMRKWKNQQLELLLGGSFQRSVRDTDELSGVGFESNKFITNIGAAKTITVGDQSSIEYRYAAIFGRLNYQFRKKYIINITGRRDGSSRFGTNNRFANFGAVGSAWIFSNETLFDRLNWLSFGKIRGSYGAAGSDNIGDFQYLDNYTVSPTLIYNNTTGLIPSRLFNPNYSWEKTRKLEAAIELGFLKDRINTTIAWYRNRSSNQLVGYQLSAVTGFSSVMANLNATVQNTGLEIELSGKPIISHNFKWNSSFNISFPKNKLISFPGLEGSSYANQFAIGYSTQIVKLYQLEGIDPKTGRYKFTDFNGDGKISSPDDNKIIREIGVKFFGGLSNTFQYKNWDLSVLFQFVKQDRSNFNAALALPGGMTNQPTEVLDVWSLGNPNGTYMPYRTTDSDGSQTLFRRSTATVSDASFIRLKNVQVGYSLPLKSSIFQNVKIYFQGQNLVTWTNFFDIDPELFSSSSLPLSRTYMFGIQFNL